VVSRGCRVLVALNKTDIVTPAEIDNRHAELEGLLTQVRLISSPSPHLVFTLSSPTPHLILILTLTPILTDLRRG